MRETDFAACLRAVRDTAPLVQCITNFVTVNDCANIILAAGGSPTMAHDIREVEEAVAGVNALVCNLGAIGDVEAMLLAGKKANELGIPVVLDPVAAGVTTLRREASARLLSDLRFAVIRGNASEIKALASGGNGGSGVDVSAADAVTEENLSRTVELARALARRTGAVAAVSGAALAIGVTAVLGVVFTDLFHIHGAVMESSESLLYAGYQNLDLTKIFMASIFLGSSGAVMDLAVDICSAVYEVVQKRPDITAREAIASGFAVGRAACGSTTTTLLLAYSGSYIALLMVFMAQGTPVSFILNYKYVAAEIVHTIVGSFGLVTVAPLTAITSGLLLTRKTGT